MRNVKYSTIPGGGNRAFGSAKVRKWGDLPVAGSEAAFPVCEGSGEKAKIAGVQDADLLSFRCAGGGECGWLFGNFNARICKIVVFFSDGQC